MSWAAALIGGAASLIGGERANDASAKSAATQMEFQREAMLTQHQREVEDLRKAGLNPMLSANKGAGLPSGASYKAENTIGPAVASAIQAKQLDLDIKKQGAEVENLHATNALINSQRDKTNVEARVLKRTLPEADTKNKFYDVLRPYIDKAAEGLSHSSKSIEQRNREAIEQFNRMTGKKLNPNKGR